MIGYAETRQAIDRRRRLMSAEELAESDLLLGEFGVVLSPVCDVPVPNVEQGDLLIRRLISARLWKHVLLIVALTALLGGVGLASITADSSSLIGLESGPTESGPATRGQPPAAVGTAGILLCLAGQLCFVIGWRRSQSPLDFHGGYHAWKWMSGILVTAGVLTITDAGPEAAGVLQLLVEALTGPISAARPVLLLMPVSCCLIHVAARILPDMRANLAALAILSAACLTTAVLAALESGVARLVPGLPVRVVLMLANAGLVFAACLLHCRFVMHVSHHPGGRVSLATQLTTLTDFRELDTPKAGQAAAQAKAPAELPDGLAGVSRNLAGESPGQLAAENAAAAETSLPAPQDLNPTDDQAQAARKDFGRQKNQRRLKKAG